MRILTRTATTEVHQELYEMMRIMVNLYGKEQSEGLIVLNENQDSYEI